MRKLLFIVLLLGVGVVGLGFYLGWFSFSSSRDPDTGQKKFELSVDQEKMKADTQKAKQKVTGTASKGTEEQGGK